MYRGTYMRPSTNGKNLKLVRGRAGLQDKFSLLERGSCLAVASLANSLEQLGLGALDEDGSFHEELQKALSPKPLKSRFP